MSWARYDDGFHEHPKTAAVLEEDPAALALHLVANTWTHRNRRYGFIPRASAHRLVGRARAEAWAAVLVRHGLWQEGEDGWEFHDWADYSWSEVRRHAATARWGRQDAAAMQPDAHALQPDAHALQTDASRAPRAQDSHARGARGLPRAPGARTPEPEPEPEESPNGDSGVVRGVFELWREISGHNQARLTPKRAKLVRDRLRDGYDEGDLRDAVRGVVLDPWPERVHHNDMTVVLRDGEHVEKFRDFTRNGVPAVRRQAPENPVDASIRRIGVIDGESA